MNIIKWVAVIIIAYVGGYFSNFPADDSATTNMLSSEVDCPAIEENIEQNVLSRDRQDQRSIVKTASVLRKESQAVKDLDEKNSRNESNLPAQIESGRIDAEAEDTSNTEKVQVPSKSNISDEEIDKLVPAPFNEALKRAPDTVREKYKEFSESTQQGSWDVTMQNKITDALLGNSYSKFIEVHMVSCKLNVCEIRGKELKPGVVNLVFSEMALQDWWDIGHSLWSNSGEHSTFYSLLLKK